MNKQKQAFTLVELIVVITILAILGTIAFISMQSYSKTARDSTRISDLSTIKTSLELFHLNAGKYPVTTDGFTIVYSGSEVWTQGDFGETTFNSVSKLDKIPLDPLTERKYTYSVTKTKQEYQLSGIFEGDELVYNSILNQANAGDALVSAIVTGNYNGKILKSLTGSNCEILTVPSIISSLPNTTTNLTDILTNTGLVYNGFNNLPSNYRVSKYNADGGFAFTSNKLIAYSDAVECGPLYDPDDNTARTTLITNLQEAYSGTIIENNDGIQELVSIDLTNPNTVDLAGAVFVNNNLKGKIKIPKHDDGGSITQWRDIDTNCNQDDIIIGSQTWAGCNSTLGNGTDSYTGASSTCLDYNFNYVYDESCFGNYTLIEKDYFDLHITSAGNDNGDIGVNNIWGKFYTWDQAMGNAGPGACQNGYHVPTGNDMYDLISSLGCTTSNTNIDTVNECIGLGGKYHSTTNSSTSIIERLQIPYSGYSWTDLENFERGHRLYLWTADEVDGTQANYIRSWLEQETLSYRTDDKILRYSVRCIKD